MVKKEKERFVKEIYNTVEKTQDKERSIKLVSPDIEVYVNSKFKEDKIEKLNNLAMKNYYTMKKTKRGKLNYIG